MAPSAIQAGGTVFTLEGLIPPSMPRALDTGEIAGLVEDYRKGSLLAWEAGFDGVEIHAANGYLLEQFLRDSTNVRTDGYGGRIENRAPALEVAAAICQVWDADRVGIRLSPLSTIIGDTPLDSDPAATYGYLASELGKLGLAWLHCTDMDGMIRGRARSAGLLRATTRLRRPLYLQWGL